MKKIEISPFFICWRLVVLQIAYTTQDMHDFPDLCLLWTDKGTENPAQDPARTNV